MNELVICFRTDDHMLINALTWAFPVADYTFIDMSEGKLFDKQYLAKWLDKYDGVVIFGNSFGILRGSPWCATFGDGLEEVIQEKIYTYYDGFLPIGLATICEYGGRKFIYAPACMSTEDIKQTMNIFLAMKAVLKAISIYNDNNEDQLDKILIGGDIARGMNKIAAVYQIRVAYDAHYHQGILYKVQNNPEKTRRLHHRMLMLKEPFNIKTDDL